DHVRASFDAVGDDRVVEGRELAALGSDDVDDVRTGAVYLRPHLVEHAPQLLHLGFTRAVDERRAALGQGGGHHQVFGARDGGHVEVHLVAAQASAARGALGQDVTALDLDGAPERLEALEVLVHGTGTDLAT